MAGERILVVDDNPINTRLTRMLLEKEGYEVITAADGEQALQTVNEFHPRVILMDIQLPGMDGLEVTRQIKANPEYADVVVVALTAYAMKGDEERALQAGCDGYVSKPINTRALPRTIREHIDGRSAPRSSGYQSASGSADSSVIDLGALGQRVGGDMQLLGEIVDLFLNRYAALLTTIRQAIASRDFKTLEKTAHSLRGYLVNFYAKPASEAARLLEVKGRLSDAGGVEETLSNLEREIELLLPLLGSLPRKQVPALHA